MTWHCRSLLVTATWVSLYTVTCGISCGEAQGQHPSLQKYPVWSIRLRKRGRAANCPHGLFLGCSRGPVPDLHTKEHALPGPLTLQTSCRMGVLSRLDLNWKTQPGACRKQGLGNRRNIEYHVELRDMGSFCKVENIKDAQYS